MFSYLAGLKKVSYTVLFTEMLFLMEWNNISVNKISVGMEWALHYSENGLAIPFLTEWKDLIQFQSEWNKLSIPTTLGILIWPPLECHSFHNLNPIRPGVPDPGNNWGGTVLWNRGSWVQFRLWHYMLRILIFSGGIWVIYHYYGDGGSQKMLKKNTWVRLLHSALK